MNKRLVENKHYLSMFAKAEYMEKLMRILGLDNPKAVFDTINALGTGHIKVKSEAGTGE